MKGPFHALLDARLRADSVMVELPSVVLLGILQKRPVLRHLVQPSRLLLVLVRPELLLSLQLADALRCLFFFLSQLNDTILDLSFLVVHFFREDYSVHHHVLGFLPRHGAHTGVHELVLFLDRNELALESGVHGGTRVCRAVHNIITTYF